jgi:SAM-dependent methyltransferase
MSSDLPNCRSCGLSGLQVILSLGKTPLANSLPTKEQLDRFTVEPEEVFPLDVAFCPHCALVQITETVPPEKLFREYLYFSSFSDTVLQNAREIVERLIPMHKLKTSSLVVELASNDGYLLQYYRQYGIPVLGIEPALNVAQVANEAGIPTIAEFFNEELALRLVSEGKQADIIHANNVLAHVASLNSFVAGIARLLKDRGTAVIETPYVKELLDRVEFDTIYHEHLCYYSLTALQNLFERHGLIVHDIEQIPIHGGTLRVFVGKEGFCKPTPAVIIMKREEELWGAGRVEYYRGFAKRVEDLKKHLTTSLYDLKRQGKKIAAYGAAAKGSTLLNYFNIGLETIDFVVDRSKYKQGRYMPGVYIPILEPAKLLEKQPDYVLMLSWNVAEEIMRQQAEYRLRGGKFIIPVPSVKIV